MMTNREKPPSSRKSRRRRRRIKKPKFVSLVQLSHEKHPEQPPLETITEKHHLQLNLFPLHPDDDHDHQNMAHLFSAADGGATSITSLLGSADDTDKNINTSLSSSVSAATNYPCGATFSNFSPSPENVRTDPITLVRTALRNYRGTEESEERWVSYSEVVEKRSYEEVSSVDNYQKQRRNNINDNSSSKSNTLALKLDYNEIMDAWSDRGPFYIHGDSSLQIVPHHILLPNHDTTSNGLQDESEANDTWRVPEMGVIENVSNDNSSSVTRDKVVAVGEEYYWKIEGQRQASIRRYKEKRQNRLFAKRIRYQVRKLNAEKRPRVKGRFVKRG